MINAKVCLIDRESRNNFGSEQSKKHKFGGGTTAKMNMKAVAFQVNIFILKTA